MMEYFRKVTNTVLPTKSRNKDVANDESDTDDDDILFTTANTSKKKIKKNPLERQKSLKSKAEEVKILSSAVDNFRGKLSQQNYFMQFKLHQFRCFTSCQEQGNLFFSKDSIFYKSRQYFKEFSQSLLQWCRASSVEESFE